MSGGYSSEVEASEGGGADSKAEDSAALSWGAWVACGAWVLWAGCDAGAEASGGPAVRTSAREVSVKRVLAL